MSVLPLPENPHVYIALQPVDFRLGINGLSMMIRLKLNYNAAESSLFLFTNKRRNCVKLLYWHRNGYCLWMKKLEEDRFYWPKSTAHSAENAVITLTVQQLEWLLEGIDISKVQPHQTRHYGIHA